MKGYLCGGIFGLDDGAANSWRTKAKERMPDIEWLDPMRRDFRGKEAGNCRAIVEQSDGCGNLLLTNIQFLSDNQSDVMCISLHK